MYWFIQGECTDKAKVSQNFNYEKQIYCPEATEQLSTKLRDTLNLLHDHLALSCYENQFTR